MRHTIIRTPIRRNYGDSHGRETLAANLDKENRPAMACWKSNGYLRVQIDVRFVPELELKPILADRPLTDINGPRLGATNLG